MRIARTEVQYLATPAQVAVHPLALVSTPQGRFRFHHIVPEHRSTVEAYRVAQW